MTCIDARRTCRACLMLFLLAVSGSSRGIDAQEHDHEHGLHFSHPLFTESISPDTKLRLDWALASPGSDQEIEPEGEYAFGRVFSVEAGVHFDPKEGNLGDTHVLLKFANFALEERNVLLGYGIGFGLPTGSGHGHELEPELPGAPTPGPESAEEDIWEFEPFLNAGWKRGALELTGWTRFNIPTNQGEQVEVGTTLFYDLAALYHLGTRVQGVLELNGQAGLSGSTASRAALSVAPGVKVRPAAAVPLLVGVGVSLPVTDQREFDSQLLLSAFYHF